MSGIENSEVVITDDIAVIGIILTSKIFDNNIEKIENKIEEQVKDIDKSINEVKVNCSLELESEIINKQNINEPEESEQIYKLPDELIDSTRKVVPTL